MEKSQNNQKKGGKCLKTVIDKLFHGSLQTLLAFLLIILTFSHNSCLEYRLNEV